MSPLRGWIRPRGRKLEAVIAFDDGTQRTKSTGFDVGQEEDAQRFLEVLLAELGAGAAAAPAGEALTVRRWGEAWIAERKARKVVSADNEQAQFRYHVFPQLGDVPLVDVTKAAALEWVRGLTSRNCVGSAETLSPRTVHHVAGTFRRLMQEAVDRELLATNPCAWRTKRDLPAKRDKVAGKRNHSGFAAWEVWQLLHDERVPEDRRVMYGLDFLTGMRPGEVAARRWRDLDTTTSPLWRLDVDTAFNSRHYVEKSTKTNVSKVIPVHPLLAELLRGWYAGGWQAFMGRTPTPDDLVVPREEGGQRTNTHSNKRFQSDLRKLGLRGARTHYETRATFRSLAMGGGAPLEALNLITHPSPREASELYTRIDQVWPAMCRAVEAVRLTAERPDGVEGEDGERSQQIAVSDPEKEKARRLSGFGPSQEVGAEGFEPSTPAV